MEDLKQIAIYYVSSNIDLIWLDEEEFISLMDFTMEHPSHERKWMTYRNTIEDDIHEMWLNLDNVEKIVEK